ncbi:MAG: hypothetical protein GXP39_07040 [Chloroflexi bacterium]|nr:hypothetical protein [Chloroflexota bacterium]
MTRVLEDRGRWLLARGYAGFVITSDEEMVRVGKDPAYKTQAFQRSFVDVCEHAVRVGIPRVGVSYDYFFGGMERRIYPTDPECVHTYKRLYDVATSYGLDFEASILSPLDLGIPWRRSGREPGRWFQFQEAAFAPDGSYRVALPLQVTWFHNKGPCRLSVDHVRVYAFREERLGDSAYYFVDPTAIQDVSDTAAYTITDPGTYNVTGDLTPDRGYHVGEIVVHGRAPGLGGHHLLAVVVYRVDEMDYFALDALDFLKHVVDLHAGAGIRYGGFYSDEMHIQWDWHLNAHIGHDEIHARYLTDGLARRYAALYGAEFRDFARYLVYFAYHQHDFMEGPEATLPSQHVLAPDEAGIARTVWLRRNYYHLLNDHVVDLFTQARDYAAERFGRPMFTQAHATWQESPTCDWFAPDYAFGQQLPEGASRYDYTPLYVWSSSQHEAAATGYDVFRWGDFLTGMGNDYPEGGNTDRNHYGKAMAASFAALDDYGLSYCGFWGSPRPVMRRMRNGVAAYGVTRSPANWVQEYRARVTPVLVLYPLDLFYVEERFGSWMVQYGYADYITQQKLLERAAVEDGTLVVRSRDGERRYTHLVALFEPLLRPETQMMLRQFVEGGGTLVWSGPPATVDEGSGRLLDASWDGWIGAQGSLFGGRPAPGGTIHFGGPLAGVAPMTIDTDLRPDWVYLLEPLAGEPCAWLEEGDGKVTVVGVWRRVGRGQVVTLGFRPRDDQSGSTGRDWRTLFEILQALGAYPGDDHPEALSRTGDYLICRSPNGAISIARQYAELAECWSGEFFRDEEADARLNLKLPPVTIDLDDVLIAGHRITYHGRDLLSYRLDEAGRLLACFAAGATGITVDGEAYQWSQHPIELLFALVSPERLAPGVARACVIVVRPDTGGEDGPLYEWLDLEAEGAMGGDPIHVRLPVDTRGWHAVHLGALDLFSGRVDETRALEPAACLDLTVAPSQMGRWFILYEPGG